MRTSTAKDLGIYFDEELTFKKHYDYIIGKSYRLLGFITRITKEFKKPSSVLHLFNSLIRSVLEYASPIWSPYYDVHTDRIEGVEKNA